MRLDRDDVIVLQQILAHPSGVLTAEELASRNPDVDSGSLQSRIDRLLDRGLIARIDSHLAVTESGITLLKESNLYDEIGVWADVYGQVDDSDCGDRPSPGWYPD